jgi:exonuclease III
MKFLLILQNLAMSFALRIVQYNVEWLFIDYYKSSDCPGNGCDWKNYTDAENHLNIVSERLKYLNPDIINLCEVEGLTELNMLNANLNNEYGVYFEKGKDTATGQNVAMLSKIKPIVDLYRTEIHYDYPIDGSQCNYNGNVSSTGVSKHYITEFMFENIPVAFIAAHLIAFPTSSSRCAQREAQASILQSIIFDYIKKDYEIIMIGDFNDYDANILDVNNHIPISHTLEILKGLKGPYSGSYELENIAETIVQSERYSDWYNSNGKCTPSTKDYSMIDHILVSSGIRNNIIDTFIYHGYDEYCGKYDSDHYPVIIDLL